MVYIFSALIYLFLGVCIAAMNELTYGKIWDAPILTVVLSWPYFIIREIIKNGF